jgi:arylsulfatase A-like enzyme
MFVMTFQRLRYLITSFLLMGTVLLGSNTKPNIVFFFIDDLGWTDVSYMGSKYYETPHVDQLAKEGMVFDNAYANAPNCAPSRACLMSGQYTPRHGVYTVGDSKRGNHSLRKLEPTPNETTLGEEFITIAEALGTNGYTCATMGKWHLGKDPTTQGFHINIAGREWGSPSGGGYHSPYQYPNLVNDKPGEYLTDRLAVEACKFIEAHKDKPFFLYLTHYTVHTPIQAKEELTKKYKDKPTHGGHVDPKYAAMIESMDDSVGAVLGKLKEMGLDENTMVVFFSDNGGHGGVTSNAPLRGSKGMLYEGGIREPFIFKYPGVTPCNSVCHEPIIGIDLYPTFLAATGTPAPRNYTLDGNSLLPLLKDPNATLNREALFWHFPAYLQGYTERHGAFRTTPAGAIRAGDWKLIEYFEDGALELYNLSTDLGEANNLASTETDKRDQLHQMMKAWRQKVNAPVPTTPNPLYTGESSGNKGKKGKKN